MLACFSLGSVQEHSVLEGAIVHHLTDSTLPRNVEEPRVWIYRIMGMTLKSEGSFSTINLKRNKETEAT